MIYIPSMSQKAIEERQSWQYKAVAYTHGNKSKVGALLVAILGRKTNPPCYHIRGCKIDPQGRVIALADNGMGFSIECIYPTVQAFTDVFRGLADILELSDGERESMFAEIRKWVFKDERPQNTHLFD